MFDFNLISSDEKFNKWYDEEVAPINFNMSEEAQSLAKICAKRAWTRRSTYHLDDILEILSTMQNISKEVLL